MLAEMRAQGEGFFRFAMRMSRQHQDYFRQLPPNPAPVVDFRQLALQSLQWQSEREAADREPFAEYLQRYLAQTL